MSLEKKISGSDGPIAALMRLTEGMPTVANYAMKRIAHEAIHHAQNYLRHREEPYGENWEELWRSDDFGTTASNLGKWTPEFNKNERKSEANRTNDDQLFDTGKLAESIRILSQSKVRSGTKAHVTIGSRLPYAAIQEFGGWNNLGKYIPARPYLIPAIEEVMNDRRFMAILKKEIVAMMKKSVTTKSKVEEPEWE